MNDTTDNAATIEPPDWWKAPPAWNNLPPELQAAIVEEHHEPPDLRLRAGSDAENAGVRLPNINGGFTGSAPDLGAYEVGSELPVYGPRIPAQ